MPIGQAKFGLLGGVVDPGKLELIETQTAISGDSAMDFTTLGSYNVHFLIATNYKGATDGQILNLRVSDDGGSTFKSAGYQYAYQKGQAEIKANNPIAIS